MSSNLFTQSERARAHLISSGDTHSAFGKIYTLIENGKIRVDVTLKDLHGTEGWHTGVALDGSRSMQHFYGRGLLRNPTLTSNIYDQYVAKGWIQKVQEDGKLIEKWKKEAFTDAIKNGYMEYTKNELQPLVHQLSKYLLDELESGNGIEMLYWACGSTSEGIEPIDLISDDNVSSAQINGPKKFGVETRLQPALDYFLNNMPVKKKLFLLFITDGRIEDMDMVSKVTIALANEIEAGQREMVKCVLIGVGPEIDRDQFEMLDNLETGTDVDIWDQKIADEMKDLNEVVAEVVSESTLIASTGSILNAQGDLLHRFYDGLSTRISFEVPMGTDLFILDANGVQIAQKITHKK